MVARSLKGSWLPLALVAGALVALAAWASLAGLAHAGANSVTAETVTVPPGGSGTIQITAEAPANDLGAWEIDVEYHSGAITVTGCEAGSVGMNLCDDTFVEPDMFPPEPGKVRVAGDDANGASGELVLATISFVSVVGGVFPTQDGCAEISVTVNQFADPAGRETNPSVTNGKVCIQAQAGANSVTAETVTIAPGGSGTIQITAEAPVNDLGAWEIDVGYHSGAILVTGCEAGSVGMNRCDDTFVEPNVFPPEPGKVRVVGDDANGASGELVLATISFVSVVGGVFPTQDGCAEISVTVNQFADPAGRETNPSVTNGKVCFQEATPEPTAAPTSGPTATPADIPATGGPPASGSDIAAYLLVAVGLALAASGAFVVSRMRRTEI